MQNFTKCPKTLFPLYFPWHRLSLVLCMCLFMFLYTGLTVYWVSVCWSLCVFWCIPASTIILSYILLFYSNKIMFAVCICVCVCVCILWMMMKMHLVQEVKYFYPTNQTERLQCTDNNYEQTTLTWKCIFLVLYIGVSYGIYVYFLYAWKTILCTQCVYMHRITTKKHSFSYIMCVCVVLSYQNIPLSFSMCVFPLLYE